MFELGRVVAAASAFEMTLRMAFCALVDSKYAALLAGGVGADALIEDCKALIAANREVPEPERQALKDCLGRAQTANRKRNRLVHDSWGSGPGGTVSQLRSPRRDHNLDVSEVTINHIQGVERELRSASSEIGEWIWNVMLLSVGLEAQLRWEDLLRTRSPAELLEMAKSRSVRVRAKQAAQGEDRAIRADRRTIRLAGLRLMAAAAEEPDVMQAARVRDVARWALNIADGARPPLPVAGFAAAFRAR